MNGDIKVLMPKDRAMILDDELAIGVKNIPAIGTRFSMDVSDDALRRLGREAVAHSVVTLAEVTVHRHGREIQNAVHEFILNKEWALPIIEDEIRKTVRQMIVDMFTRPSEAESDV